jgi:hypothetical protein
MLLCLALDQSAINFRLRAELRNIRSKIKLVALNPSPTVKDPIDPKDYEATLVVTKDE